MLDSPVSGASFQGVATHEPEFQSGFATLDGGGRLKTAQDVVLLGKMTDNSGCRVSDSFPYSLVGF